jgi:hypothetical protein
MRNEDKIHRSDNSDNSHGTFDFMFRRANRGLLLDIVVFVLNLFLMRMLAKYFWDIAHSAANGDRLSTITMALFCLSIFVLPPVGAVLKRWHYHQRVKEDPIEKSTLAGCLFNPIFYFCMMFVLFALVDAYIMQFLSPEDDFSPGVFLGSMLIGVTVTVVHTWLVYRYFTTPKQPPSSAFLRSPSSEIVGDVCIFVNMINFQILWNSPALYRMPHPKDLEEFVGRLLVFSFVALLVYFPPRMFYLVDDIDKRRTWMTMLLANSPVLYHVLIGTGSSSTTGW